jgi:hypothetical protein
MDKDGHRVEHDEVLTPCWVEVQPGVECSILTEDPLGLCDRHRAELLMH